jgi:hypothetical protein
LASARTTDGRWIRRQSARLPRPDRCAATGGGRAFLAFDHPAGLADLEVAVLDQIEATPATSPRREELMRGREIVRAWRRDSRLVFRPMSILVVEGSGTFERRRLPVFKTGNAQVEQPVTVGAATGKSPGP